MSTPDVTVSLAVYNTMPYLQETLDSLVAQSIGHDRLEVVAVDDGSTDGSGELLDEYAARHPALFRVLHQANSGGPAGPCNRALEIATGRFVYFLGADDHLAPEALERMVAYADEHDADIVMGRVVGVNGRDIKQGVFRRDDPDLDRYGPDLRWSLANTHLYRRSLVERLGLRYVEGLPFGSDQPFMLEAVVNARRIAVLAGYTCYYAVDRQDRANISYSTPYPELLRCVGVLVDTAARLLPEGRPRDTVLVRHFTWEVPRLLRQGFRELPESSWKQVCDDVASFVERYADEAVLAGLRVVPRVLLHLARRGEVGLLAQMLREGEEGRHRRLLVAEDGVYVDYPGLERGAPDRAYLLPDARGLRDRMRDAMSCTDLRWEGRGAAGRLVVELATNLVDHTGAATFGAEMRRAGDVRSVPDVEVTPRPDGASVVLRVDVPGLPPTGPDGEGWRLLLTVDAVGHFVAVPVPRSGETPGKLRSADRSGLTVAWVDETRGQDGLVVRTGHLPFRHLHRVVKRRLAHRRK